MNSTRARAILTTATAVLALALTACTGTSNNPPSTGLPDTKTDTPAGSDPAAPPAASTEGDLKATITWPDGLAVTLTDLERGKSGPYAAPKENAPIIAFKVTFTNGTAEAIDLTLLTVNCSVGPDGDNAEQVYDSEQGLGDGADGTVQPGKKKSGKYGCLMPAKVTELQVEIELYDTLDRDPAIFTGNVPA